MNTAKSTTWTGRRRTECLDQHCAIDVRRWAKAGFTDPASVVTREWVNPRGIALRLQISAHLGYLELSGDQKIGDGWRPVRAKLQPRFTPCHFGGRRLWVACPVCGYQVAILYVCNTRVVCRKCLALPYRSQCENTLDREMRRLRKIRRKLGASKNLAEPIPDKPKGMHWATYWKLRLEVAELQSRLHTALVGSLEGNVQDSDN